MVERHSAQACGLRAITHLQDVNPKSTPQSPALVELHILILPGVEQGAELGAVIRRESWV